MNSNHIQKKKWRRQTY